MRLRSASLMIAAVLAASPSTAGQYGNLPEEPVSTATYTYEAPASIDAGGGRHPDVALHEVNCTVLLLYVPSEATEWAAGLDLTWTRLAFSGIGWRDLDLYQLPLPLDLVLKSEPWTWWLNVTPGLFGDLDEITGDDYRTLVHAAGLFRSGPHLQWGLGMAYDRVLGEDRFYPMGGFIWDNGWDLRLQALLPEVRLDWAPSRSWLAFLQAVPAGGVWHLREDGGEYDLKIEGFRLLGGCEVLIAPHVWVHAGTGVSVLRNYELREPSGNKVDSEADEVWVGQIALVLR